ncbi:MAG: hypothetical protein IPM57_08185 [Oligoflexia bacterium]|nr:hypothetical protein [Oligoflexia bacterium]
MSIKSLDFRYILCPGSLPDPHFIDYYKKIYECWYSVWKDAFVELGVNKAMYSDCFTRQDYIGAIFYKNTCVALSFFRWTNATLPDFSQDSYFANWSSAHQKTLRSRGDKIIVCSYFTVHPMARSTKLGVSGKDLLMGMIVETFMNSKADGMTGAVRVNKSVNDAGYRWGAFKIDTDIPSGVGEATVDLIGFFKDYIAKFPAHELKELAKEIWDTRLVIPRQKFDNEFTDTSNYSETEFEAA